MAVLALETSTSSAKALVFDLQEGIIECCRSNYPPDISGRGMSDAQAVYRLCLKTGREAVAAAGTALSRAGHELTIDAVALCGTWHGMCALDADMQPVSPVYSWNFTGTAGICASIRQNDELTGEIYRRSGCMPHCTYPRHAIQYMKQEGMDLSDKRFITQGAYNFWGMTGYYEETVCTQSGSGLINLEKQAYDPLILELTDIDASQLGALTDYRHPRPLNRQAADVLGLKPGIPVIPAHADGAMNQIGNYASGCDVMTLSVGTSGAIRMVTGRPKVSPKRALWCYCAAEGWITGASTAGACNCLNWFMKGPGAGRSFRELEDTQDAVTDVPVFLPFLYGERCPGWRDEREGGFWHLSGQHTAAHMYKSVQMGILYNLKKCYGEMTAENSAPRQIIVSGGISNSRQWVQMLADIFERDVLVSDFSNASTIGAAVLALVQTGELRSIKDFRWGSDRLVAVRAREDQYPFYREMYEEWNEAYRSL